MEQRFYGTCNGNPISKSQIHWGLADATAYGSGLPIQPLASQSCITNNLPVRTINTDSSGNDPVYFGIALPNGTKSSIYTGQNTFATNAGACPQA